MQRRKFLQTATLGLASLTAANHANATSVKRCRMLSRWDPNFPFQYAAAERFAHRVAELSGSRLQIEVLRSSTLGAIDKTFDAVSKGEAEMCRSLSYEWRGKNAAFTPFFVMPFGMTETEVVAWIRVMGGQALWDELYAPYNLKPYLVGALGAQAFGFFKSEIRDASSLRGLRYRTTGSTVAIATAAGMRAVELPPTSIRAAIEAGEIDAFELVGPCVDLALGVHDILPYYYWPGFHQPSGAVELIVNKSFHDKLPADLKAVLAVAAEAEHHANVHEVYAGNARALEVLQQRHGVKVRRVPDSVMTTLSDATNQVWGEIYTNSKGLDRRIYDSFLNARTLLRPWTAMTERDFVDSREKQARYFNRS